MHKLNLQFIKCYQLQEASLLTPKPGALPLDATGRHTPRILYRLTLDAFAIRYTRSIILLAYTISYRWTK